MTQTSHPNDAQFPRLPAIAMSELRQKTKPCIEADVKHSRRQAVEPSLAGCKPGLAWKEETPLLRPQSIALFIIIWKTHAQHTHTHTHRANKQLLSQIYFDMVHYRK
ncbi:hypothetical protein RRG08_031021 [Elysia crispata]|uniref:Uncharacterized protein n=1 Tax=Elysia crispata TaxID=231223 RepID=A0AAE1AEW9_9GAST|nr:hypothetical protein RRG08_031021 [Elysia crispata]